MSELKGGWYEDRTRTVDVAHLVELAYRRKAFHIELACGVMPTDDDDGVLGVYLREVVFAQGSVALGIRFVDSLLCEVVWGRRLGPIDAGGLAHISQMKAILLVLV